MNPNFGSAFLSTGKAVPKTSGTGQLSEQIRSSSEKGQPVGAKRTPAVQAVPEGAAGGVMEHPLWMLVPWAVLAVAAGIKFWRLTALFRKGVLSRATGSERVRQSLERIWAKESRPTVRYRTSYSGSGHRAVLDGSAFLLGALLAG